MIFCSDHDVDDIWQVIARATAANELGIAAKVGTRPEDEGIKRDRVICVYTADFTDKADVGRVLQKLRELKLVEAKNRSVYYKPGKFTPQPCTRKMRKPKLISSQMPLLISGLRLVIRGVSKLRCIAHGMYFPVKAYIVGFNCLGRVRLAQLAPCAPC